MVFGKSTTALLAGASALAIIAAVADAATVNGFFTGTVNGVSSTGTAAVPSGVSLGDTVIGQFSYDTTQVLSTTPSNPGQVTYLFDPTSPNVSFSLSIGGNVWNAPPSTYQLRVADNGPAGQNGQTLFDDVSLTTWSYGNTPTSSSLGNDVLQAGMNLQTTFPTLPDLVTSNSIPLDASGLNTANVYTYGQIFSSDNSNQNSFRILYSINSGSFTLGQVMTPPTIPTPTPQVQSFGNTSLFGDVANFDPNRPTVVVTHGWQPGLSFTGGSGTPILDQFYAAIDAQYNNDSDPTNDVNILLFTWSDAFTAAVTPLTVANPIAFQNLATQPLPYATNVGIDLGAALSQLLGPNYSQPLHLIGHSYGTVVNASAASELALAGISTTHMTVLDAPTQYTIPTSLYTLVGSSPWVDYLENYYGNVSLSLTPALGEAIPGAELNGGYQLNANHPGVWMQYAATIGQSGCPSSGGFSYSAALGSSGCFAVRPGQSATNLQLSAISAALTPQLLQHASFNALTSTALISTGSDGYGVFSLDVPFSATTFALDLQFTQPGDGDWLEILFGDTLLGAYQGTVLGTSTRSFLFDFSSFAGQTDFLTFLLASSGPSPAQVSLSNFRFLNIEETLPAPVPLPAGIWLLLPGLLAMFGVGWRGRTKKIEGYC